MKWSYLFDKWVVAFSAVLAVLLFYMAYHMPLNYWHHSKFSFGTDFVFNDFFPAIKLFSAVISEQDNAPIDQNNFHIFKYLSSLFSSIGLWILLAQAKQIGKVLGLVLVGVLVITQLNILWLGATSLSLSLSLFGLSFILFINRLENEKIAPNALGFFFGFIALLGSSLIGWLAIPTLLVASLKNKNKIISAGIAIALSVGLLYLVNPLLWINVKVYLSNAADNFLIFSGSKFHGADAPRFYAFTNFIKHINLGLLIFAITGFVLLKDKVKRLNNFIITLPLAAFFVLFFAPYLAGKGNYELFFLVSPFLLAAAYGLNKLVVKFNKKVGIGLIVITLLLSYKGLFGLFSLSPFQYSDTMAPFTSNTSAVANGDGEYLNIAGLNLLKKEIDTAVEGDTIATNFYHNYTFEKGTLIGVDYFKKDLKSYQKGVFTRLGFDPELQKTGVFPPQNTLERIVYNGITLSISATPQTAIKQAFKKLSGPNIGEAVVKFKELVDTFSRNPQAWYGLAKAQFEFNVWDDALASAQIGIGLHPGHIKLNTLIGEIYRKQNKNSKALEKWNKSLELWKGFGRAHWLIGEYYLSEDSLDKAKSYFINAKYCNGPISERASKSLQLIDSMENKPYLRNGVAQHFITKLNGFGSINDTSSVRLKKVIKRIKAYVELDSTNAELRAHLGIGYMMLESYTKAAITFEKAVELNPNYPQMREYLVISRVNLGAKLFEKDSLEEAIFHFRYALDYSPNNENVRANLSVAYNEMARKAFDNNELETAYAILKAAIFYNQENPTSFVQMGRLQLAINQKDSAEIAFNQAFRIDPSNEEALQELIVFYKKRSDYYKVKIYTDRLNKLIKRQLTK